MIEELIDKALLKEQEGKKDRVRSGKWSPSSFGRCYRYQYWNRKNEQPSNPPDERALKIFKVGKVFHDFVQGFIPDQETEVLVKQDDILGYADIVTKDAVIDLKSQHSRGFWYMLKETYNIAEQKYSNWLQVATYAWILKKEKCGLVFISKDDLCIKEYYMPTEKWIPEVEKELKTLRAIWEKDELPKGEPKAYGGKECQYCGYRDKCGVSISKAKKTSPRASNSKIKGV